MDMTGAAQELAEKVLSGTRVSPAEASDLYRLPLPQLGALADHRRRLKKQPHYGGRGDQIVTYIIDRNINYTNVCDVYCKFCAFYRTEKDPDHYVLTPEQVCEKIAELAAIGGTQILMQGGHHPSLGIEYYLDLLRTIRERFPQINIHGFSAPELDHFTRVFAMPLEELLTRFRDAGLGSIPGAGGEILVDPVRQRIAPRKCSADTWLHVMETAHKLGIHSSATMMFGHVESVEDRIEHLLRLRDLQDRTHGFTAFICWTFQPENTRLKLDKTGSAEYLRMQALARIVLDNFDNIQASWVTQGPSIGQVALQYGANDFGSLMMEENVVSQAGTTFRMELDQMRSLIAEQGFEPRQRNNWYRLL